MLTEASPVPATTDRAVATAISPGSFEPGRHFYPRVVNAQIHPLVGYFMRMTTERVVSRYCHLNPRVAPDTLRQVLAYQPRFLRWAGSDLFHVTTARGVRQMIVIETNTCPSGNKSMPIVSDDNEQGGYRVLMEQSFLPLLSKRSMPAGELAVIYDKNEMGCSGYAAALADLTGERVWLAPMHAGRSCAEFRDGLLHVRTPEGWLPIRAAMRYVTQKPWSSIPVTTRTLIFNPVIACLAGGRNKLMANKAYDLYNGELAGTGLEIRMPETICDLTKEEIPFYVQRFGGHAVVKVPYSNAGQGVYTITNQRELDDMLAREHDYDQFIVQSLIGNHNWSSVSRRGRFFHVGTMPNKKGELYAADVRMMVHATAEGFRPIAIYSRRARMPLVAHLDHSQSSWDILGTNLSKKLADGSWDSETDRLLLMDRRDFNALGLGPDDLIEAYVQTVLSVIAIDQLAQNLMTSKGKLRRRLFRSLNDDDALLAEFHE